VPKPDPRMEADRRYAQVLRDRAAAMQPAIAGAITNVPGGWAVFAMFKSTELFRATRNQDLRKAIAAATAPQMEVALRCVSRPSWKSVLELEALCGRQFGLLDPFYDGPSGMADRIAAAMGIEVDPPPPPPGITP
jgi:hypothetical protein